MTADPTLAALRERHLRSLRSTEKSGWCEIDGEDWPCDFERARQALDAAQAERDAALDILQIIAHAFHGKVSYHRGEFGDCDQPTCRAARKALGARVAPEAEG